MKSYCTPEIIFIRRLGEALKNIEADLIESYDYAMEFPRGDGPTLEEWRSRRAAGSVSPGLGTRNED
jgi:hypothetical protein